MHTYLDYLSQIMKPDRDMAADQNLSVSFIIGQLGLGGSEKQLYLLARELILCGWRVSVFNLNSGSSDYWTQPLEQLGISVYSLPQGYSQLARLVAITRQLIKDRPHIIHSWSLYTNVYAALCGALARIPVRLGSERGSREYSLNSYGKLRYSLCLLGLQGVITNSQVEVRLLENEKPGLRVKFIPNGADEEGLFSRMQARETLGISDEQILVAGIGSLTPNKNFEYLIRIIAKISFSYPNLKLIIIGDGPEKDRLARSASNLMQPSCFMFTGLLPEASKLLRGIDILCIPSLTEGMPNVVLEACVAGIPVVANKVGAIPSLIKDGVNGYIVETGDEAKFRSVIEKLIQDKALRNKMGAFGKKLAHTELSSGKMADRFTSFYQEMLAAQ